MESNSALPSLASLNRRSENAHIEPIVIAVLKFRDVQRQIFCADFVERAVVRHAYPTTAACQPPGASSRCQWLPLPACGERVGVRGFFRSAQTCGLAPSPARLRSASASDLSPRAGRGEARG